MTDTPKRSAGRPAVGVTKENLATYWTIIHSKISNYKLGAWLVDAEVWTNAHASFKDISITDEPSKLDAWCKTWLSKSGWKALQSAARQRTHQVKARDEKKQVRMDRVIHLQLKEYAEKQGITPDKAIEKLLRNEEFRLKADRKNEKCPHCKKKIERVIP